jgi:hypothetical protein
MCGVLRFAIVVYGLTLAVLFDYCRPFQCCLGFKQIPVIRRTAIHVARVANCVDFQRTRVKTMVVDRSGPDMTINTQAARTRQHTTTNCAVDEPYRFDHEWLGLSLLACLLLKVRSHAIDTSRTPFANVGRPAGGARRWMRYWPAAHATFSFIGAPNFSGSRNMSSSSRSRGMPFPSSSHW